MGFEGVSGGFRWPFTEAFLSVSDALHVIRWGFLGFQWHYRKFQWVLEAYWGIPDGLRVVIKDFEGM